MAEKASKDRSVVGRMGSIALGGMSIVGNRVGNTMGTVADTGLSAATTMTKGAVKVADVVTKPVRAPLNAMEMPDLVMVPVGVLGARVGSAVDKLDDKGQHVLDRGADFALLPISGTIDAVIDYLTDHPAIDRLIQVQLDRVLPLLAHNPAVLDLVLRQVDQVLPALADNPQIQDLVKIQAGAYIAYLNEHPDVLDDLIRLHGDEYINYLNQYPAAVQALVQGQSLSMASEVRDEMRERMVTADSIAGTVVRNLLRRPSLDEIPSPPEDVRRRAEYGRLPSDYVREHTYGRQ